MLTITNLGNNVWVTVKYFITKSISKRQLNIRSKYRRFISAQDFYFFVHNFHVNSFLSLVCMQYLTKCKFIFIYVLHFHLHLHLHVYLYSA